MLDRPAELFVEREAPICLRSENGSRFTAIAVRKWLEEVGVKTLFIEPGSPGRTSTWIRRKGKLRDEPLSGEIFYVLRDAQVITERWRQEYGRFGPHSSPGCSPPAPKRKQGVRPEVSRAWGTFSLVAAAAGGAWPGCSARLSFSSFVRP